MHNFHFISGLPRSGTTLLSALLSQNPSFSASISSPISSLCTALIQKMGAGTEFEVFFSQEKREKLLLSIFESYYSDLADKKIIFDTSRAWTGRLALVAALFPSSQVICCVRDVPWILDSLENATKKDPTQTSKIVSDKAKTLYGRVEAFMDQEHGLVGQAWCLLREAWFGNFAKKLIIIQYEKLVENPAEIMNKLYSAIGEPIFKHDFENIHFNADEFDNKMATPGLHRVKSKISKDTRTISIPPDVAAKYQDTSFWKNPKLNIRNVLIL